MAQIIWIEEDQMTKGHGNDVEQAAVEIKVLKIEYALIAEPARIISDDQFAIVVLHAFVVGDRIVPEGAQHEDDEAGEKGDEGVQHHYGELIIAYYASGFS